MEYNGSDLAAITVHSAMMQIALITRTEVGQLTDECLLKALDARDIPQLKDWQKIINKNIPPVQSHCANNETRKTKILRPRIPSLSCSIPSYLTSSTRQKSKE